MRCVCSLTYIYLCLAADPASLVKTIIYLNDKAKIIMLLKCLMWHLTPLELQDCVSYHHASASTEHRRIIEAGLKDGTFRWIIATDALGMGADIGDIMRVIQLRAGESPGACVQRIGRAGRNGVSKAKGIVLFEPELLKDKFDPDNGGGGKAGKGKASEVSFYTPLRLEPN
jgi:Lhr-like helicase